MTRPGAPGHRRRFKWERSRLLLPRRQADVVLRRLRTEAVMASAAPKIPADGQPIELKNARISVPDGPIIPFIEGDGTGPDIWRASQRVFDAAVEKAYGGRRKIAWAEV